MRLYENKELFLELISKISNETGINEAIIEKDYYVSLILNEISKRCSNIVFKGGTSLSKCYGLINRFSEDIDISCEKELSQSEIKNINHTIVNIVDELGLKIKNINDIKSGMDYNKFEIEYPTINKYEAIKENVIIETVFSITATPVELKDTTNIIYEYLLKNNLLNIVDYKELIPFKINTQSLERTFIDKVFAICDYYLNNDIKEHSRHLYDITKIFNNIEINQELKNNILKIRENRKHKRFCTSAQDKYNINQLLKEIIDNKVYKNDYTRS